MNRQSCRSFRPRQIDDLEHLRVFELGYRENHRNLQSSCTEARGANETPHATSRVPQCSGSQDRGWHVGVEAAHTIGVQLDRLRYSCALARPRVDVGVYFGCTHADAQLVFKRHNGSHKSCGVARAWEMAKGSKGTPVFLQLAPEPLSLSGTAFIDALLDLDCLERSHASYAM